MQPTSGLTQGTITTQNIGDPNGPNVTASSTVSLYTGGVYDTASIQITGTHTGIKTVQVMLDSLNWVNLAGTTSLTNVGTGATTATIPSAAVGIWQMDVSGFMGVRVTALAAQTGTATVSLVAGIGSGVVGIDTPITLAAGAAAIGSVTNTPALATDFALTSAATTNSTLVKATAGQLFEISADNMTAAVKYLKLYRKATAPTVGTDIPILTIPIPANGEVSREYGTVGKKFLTGIGYAITGAQPVTDTTAVAAGDVHVHGTFL